MGLLHTQKSSLTATQGLLLDNLIVMIWDLLLLMLPALRDAQMSWTRLISLLMERLELSHTQNHIGTAKDNLMVSLLYQNLNKQRYLLNNKSNGLKDLMVKTSRQSELILEPLLWNIVPTLMRG